mmetsp:Transcript_2280/g.3389  ORF Transcript_2280/g.3389 Transcript_2280/m.3389 type:complete len:80 (-) Transcript_2280:11-250(-)
MRVTSATIPGLSAPIEWMTTTFFAGAENCRVVIDVLLKFFEQIHRDEGMTARVYSVVGSTIFSSSSHCGGVVLSTGGVV